MSTFCDFSRPCVSFFYFGVLETTIGTIPYGLSEVDAKGQLALLQ